MAARWTEAQDRTLRTFYPYFGSDIPALLQHHSPDGIRIRAGRKGVRRMTKRDRVRYDAVRTTARLQAEVSVASAQHIQLGYSSSEVGAPMTPEQKADYEKNLADLTAALKGQQSRPEYPLQYTRTLAEGIPTKECAPCGKVRRWVLYHLKLFSIALVTSAFVVWVMTAIKAFGG